MRLTAGRILLQAGLLTLLGHSASAQIIINEANMGSNDFIELYNCGEERVHA
jgi:hypothetical protein